MSEIKLKSQEVNLSNCKVTESIDKENLRKTFEEIGYNEEKSRLMKEYIGEIK